MDCKQDKREQGTAAVEMALVLPMLIAVFMMLAEGSYALKTQLTLVEASREAARLVLRDGTALEVPTLVSSLTSTLPGNPAIARVVMDKDSGKIKVDIDYQYQSLLADDLFETLYDGVPIVFTASATMPLP